MTAAKALRFELVASVAWGEGPSEIPRIVEDYPNFGEVSSTQTRKVPSPVRIRMDPWGGLHSLTSSSPGRNEGSVLILHHLGDGAPTLQKNEIPLEGEEPTIIDYAVDLDMNCYLLERFRGEAGAEYNRLRKVDKEGNIVWSRYGPVGDAVDFQRVQGTFDRLFIHPQSRLLLTSSGTGSAAEVDVLTGDVSTIHKWGQPASHSFMDSQGNLQLALFFPEENRRGSGRFNPMTGEFTYHIGDSDIHAWILFPFGSDAYSNLYAWRDSIIARISPTEDIDVLATLNNVVVSPWGGRLFTSGPKHGPQPTLSVDIYSPHGVHESNASLFLPADASVGKEMPGTGWRLIHVDKTNQYYVFGGERPGTSGTLLVFSSQGELTETITPPPDLLALESHLQNPSTWEVDGEGSVYLPICDPEGFKVVRLIRAN